MIVCRNADNFFIKLKLIHINKFFAQFLNVLKTTPKIVCHEKVHFQISE